MWSSAINQNAKKARALAGSTFGIYSRFRSEMETKQEPVDSLNFFNDTVLVTGIFVSVFFSTKQDVLFIEAVRLYTSSAHI